jgi:hypothetical protein
MITLKVEGLEALRRTLDGFSDRRFNAAIATALSRTASALREEYKVQLSRVFDRPTPYTLGGLFVQTATADSLNAFVGFKDERAAGGGTPATKYLLPQVKGLQRNVKRMELALRHAGALPAGYVTVPGQGANIDAHGNIERAQVRLILEQLRRRSQVGPHRKGVQARSVMKAGAEYFVVPVGGKLQAGVYARDVFSRNITPVLIFVKQAAYRALFDFDGMGRRFSNERLPVEIRRSIEEHRQRLSSKGSR